MTYEEIINKIKPNIERAVESFKKELLKIRTSQLSPSLIEDIEVEFAGSKMPLKSLGAISVVSGRELTIQPWDKSYVEPIVRAIERSNFSLSVALEKEVIRLTTPVLTGEHREDLIRLVQEKLNNTFQEIRRLRDDVWKEIQEDFRKGEIREDDKFKGKDKLEETIKEYREKIEQAAEAKRKEIEG